ncbi:hypothetical protein ACHHYP_15998 [Achlya hypogyna]|uniref:C2H2-type domain-containing protein n=1 Tax=Achlya hypogyna TaxID=1202772 RepID=A0A1V9ZED8_ACHHY|nr:hypothetical protein ACHHYP_15998 [Achlya hypogyna]
MDDEVKTELLVEPTRFRAPRASLEADEQHILQTLLGMNPPVDEDDASNFEDARLAEACSAALQLAAPVKKPHECSQCFKRFRAKSELVTHERIHTGHKPFACMYEGCIKRFAHSSNLGAHHKAHMGIKPYVCQYAGCNKRYAHSGSLKEHVWKHYGVKPFKCTLDDCNRTFTQRSNYSRHMKKCHGVAPGS